MTGTCACGSVSVEVKRAPDFINDCNCNLCRKLGAAWGYFSGAEVSSQGATSSFVRCDKNTPAAEIHRCVNCGSVVCFTVTESYQREHGAIDQVGVNMRLFDPGDLAGLEVRFPDGLGWAGEGAYEFRRMALTISEQTPW